jgi:hypothetical protein
MDAFSERFVTALRSRLPGLLAHLHSAPDGESIELRLAAPSGHGELFVTTEGEEVTVSFGPWHGHFEELYYWPDDSPKGEPFERVLALIADFMRDLIVIRVWTKGGHYAGSMPWHWWYGEEASRTDFRGDHCSMLSWTGRGDTPPFPVDSKEILQWWEEMASQTRLRQTTGGTRANDETREGTK